MTIRACIVDDEPLARERIRTLLEQESDIEVVGESGDGGEAIAEIRAKKPDLVFLDVQMPVVDGFGVLQALDTELPRAVIFVTAYDQYALQAFEVHALDYLLKPFNGKRFKKAIERARDELTKGAGNGGVNERLLSLLENLREERRPPERLVLKSSGRVAFLKVDEIDWIEAEGNYVRLHVGPISHLLRETMKGIEAKLDPNRFIRIHRSTIVNTERIKELQPLFHGEYAVILQDGTRLTASRGPENKLRRLLDVQP
ncbi:MAG: LytTR family DNA-binding domain-containing protein [Vicinamibacteraceae bacterium]|nr:LytTR family DNA-binding domain-containing protein [Vicinamibacteraceae bacterium]